MSEIIVREATAAEAGRIAGFNRAMAMETEGAALNEQTVNAGVVALMSHPTRGFYLVAEMAGVLAGCMLITYEWSDWRNKTFWWIQSVFVKPELRGRGVYTALYAQAKQMAAAAGNVCGFRLYTHRKNERAQDVYRSLGMAQTEYVVFEEPL